MARNACMSRTYSRQTPLACRTQACGGRVCQREDSPNGPDSRIQRSRICRAEATTPRYLLSRPPRCRSRRRATRPSIYNCMTRRPITLFCHVGNKAGKNGSSCASALRSKRKARMLVSTDCVASRHSKPYPGMTKEEDSISRLHTKNAVISILQWGRGDKAESSREIKGSGSRCQTSMTEAKLV
jgi:hypothetical protein